MYNEQIAKLTNQDLIKQEISYRLNEKNNFVYEIIGENGCGKTTLINSIKSTWLHTKNGIVLALHASNHVTSNSYDVFNNLIMEKDQKKQILKNILIASLKDIPNINNSLSSIATELIDYYDQKKEDFIDDEKEILFLKKIESYINGKEVLFLCYDFELWDLKSRNLLINIITCRKLEELTTNFYFIIESTRQYLNNSIPIHKCFLLKNISIENIGEIISIFNPNINLAIEQQEQLYSFTNGNLDLLKECSVLPLLYEENNEIENFIEKNISTRTNAISDVVSLLKHAAFIGQDITAVLLNQFSDLDTEQYDDALEASIALNYLSENDKCISFVKPFLYNYYRKSFEKNRKYYIRLSKCLNTLYPSRYDMQFQYLHKGGLTEKAKINLFLFLIQYYRENNIEYNIDKIIYKDLLLGYDLEICNQICKTYKYYKEKKYEKAEQILDSLSTNRIEFRFEIHYLEALITTNKYYNSRNFEEQINILEQYNDIKFKESFPEMYIRNQMMLVEFYAESGQKDKVKDCLKAINIFFSQHISTDSQMACYEQCFKMKSNAFYSVEIAYYYTNKAYQFFKATSSQNVYLNKFYISLLNHSANETVLGKYEEAYKLLIDATNLIHINSCLKSIHEDILVNNLSISGYLLGLYTPQECIKALEMIIAKKLDGADNVLISSNLSIFYTIVGNYNKALSILSELYWKIKYNDDIDVYYQYYIYNNYALLLWLTGDCNAKIILEKSFMICPWPQDVAYFNARIDNIKYIIKNVSPAELMEKNQWLSYLYNNNSKTVGKAWKFWSSLLLFSELQIWSDY